MAVRIEEWISDITDLSLFKWHGDVSIFKKIKQRKNPASILLTTPESLDVMLASTQINRQDYFCNLSSVIIDEAHYFAADSRGAQLVSALERLQTFTAKPLQRIGLSATVGDPDAVASWLRGTSSTCEIINAHENSRKIIVEDIFIDESDEDYSKNLESNLAKYTVKGKTIIFGNSKRDVETIARLLNDSGIRTLVHHGSISKLLREEAEDQMRVDRTNLVISATSTLELGIDIGDLNRVIQKDTLPSVNSYLQRIGRAGRKDGEAHIILITGCFEDFVLNIAMATLGSEYYCEPLRPSCRRYDILLQQLLMEILGNYGISADTFFEKVKATYSFKKINREDFDKLVKIWMDTGLLLNDGRVLLLGPVITQRYGHKNFMELFSVFDVNEHFTVYFHEEEIGYLERWFVSNFHAGESVFQLAGRKWAVMDISTDTKRIYVKPAKDALPPVWRGGSNFKVEYKVARRFQDILAGSYDVTQKIKPNALKILEFFSNSHYPVPEGKIGIINIGRNVWIDTYAGSMINAILTFALMDLFPKIDVSYNFYRLEFGLHKYSMQEIIISLKNIIPDIQSMNYSNWIIFLGRHINDLSYSRFAEYIPAEFSVHHVAESDFVLSEFKSFAAQCKDDFIISF